MHVHWKRKPVLGLRANSWCKCRVPTYKLTPRLRFYKNGDYWILGYLAPAIRRCCIDNKAKEALVPWWQEVASRFVEFEFLLRDRALAQSILEQKKEIIKLLEEVVPRPPPRALKQPVGPRQLTPLVKSHLELLELTTLPTILDLGTAWKRVARKTHPDLGGGLEDFRAAHQSYQALSAYIQSQRPWTSPPQQNTF